jgi:hypothetical protein
MFMSKLLQALRAKYRTPYDAMRALGLDPKLLAMDAAHDAGEFRRTHPSRITADQEPEAEAGPQLTDANIEALLEFCATRMSDEDLRELAELLVREKEKSTANDQPLPFPGRPTPGGAPLTLSQDSVMISRKARSLAYDAKTRARSNAEASFSRIYPKARTPGVIPGNGERAQRRQPIDPAAEAHFYRCFPKLAA